MFYDSIIEAMKRYGSAPDAVCRYFLGLRPEEVGETVILSPWWKPGMLNSFGGTSRMLSRAGPIATWEIDIGGTEATYVRTGAGAPLVADAVLALGLTACRRIVFTGSVGALDPCMKIGDIVVPERAVSGDGASRYLKPGALSANDPFGETTFPDAALYSKLKAAAARVCRGHNVGLHRGRVFTVDTVFAQFVRLEEIMGLGCNAIEMETAAAFRAADLAGKPLAALLSVSDNIVVNKSLMNGETKGEKAFRRKVCATVFPEIIMGLVKE